MKNELQLMVDIECLSLRQNALIVEIGAAFFTLNKNGSSQILPTDEAQFEIAVDIKSDLKDRHIDINTVGWWLQQAKKVQPKWLESRYSLDQAMQEFKIFVVDYNDDRAFKDKSFAAGDYNIWGHGSDFDTVILKDSLDAYGYFGQAFYYRDDGEIALWQRRNVRDTRTLFDLSGFDYSSYAKEHNSENAHSALHDAVTQANGVIAAFNKLHGIEGNLTNA